MANRWRKRVVFKYLGLQVPAEGGFENDVAHRMNEGYRAWEGYRA